MLIVGQSGAGKTAMLMRFLLTSALLNYDKLYVFARSLHQAEYQCLMDGFENKLHKLDIQDMLGVGDLIRKKKSSIKEVAVGLREHNDEKITLRGVEAVTVTRSTSVKIILIFRCTRLDLMPIDEFKKLCKNCWDLKYGYLVIDLSRDYESGL